MVLQYPLLNPQMLSDLSAHCLGLEKPLVLIIQQALVVVELIKGFIVPLEEVGD